MALSSKYANFATFLKKKNPSIWAFEKYTFKNLVGLDEKVKIQDHIRGYFVNSKPSIDTKNDKRKRRYK